MVASSIFFSIAVAVGWWLSSNAKIPVDIQLRAGSNPKRISIQILEPQGATWNWGNNGVHKVTVPIPRWSVERCLRVVYLTSYKPNKFYRGGVVCHKSLSEVGLDSCEC